MPFKNRIRLPFYLSQPQFPVEKSVFRKANGTSHLLSAVVRNTYNGKTDQLPEDWHRKLIIALTHKDVTIEDARFLSDVVLDGDYEIDWQDFLNHPIAGAAFKIQTTPFDASNSNCQSCEDITSLNLVDDYTDEVWDEGTTHEYPDLVTGNDQICCFPFEIQLMSYNTLYFENVTIDETGLLTATVKNPVPDLSNVLLATYRVTCENGGYDEANVYVNIQGSAVVCLPPTNLQEFKLEGDTNVYFTWDEPVPPPAGGYDWELYLSSDLFTPVDSGNVAVGTHNLTVNGAALLNASYTFIVVSKCGGGISVPVQLVFNNANRTAGTCGNFTVSYIPSVSEGLQSASYMDCDGLVQTYNFTGAGIVELCMLINAGEETPVFFAASTTDISINYNSLC